ncbi:unnamed protein product [Euphydryas editha]|uniref:Uncharacterized protein n=1 Tax=Euphydryas editha TaxID=104508 RepID=A0AAU9V5E9_EUPED|nr:unnamed protein product [Euphydryas editha]
MVYYDTPRLHMGGVDIVFSNDIKLLGVVIDRKLTFHTHVTNVRKRAIFTTSWRKRLGSAGVYPPASFTEQWLSL